MVNGQCEMTICHFKIVKQTVDKTVIYFIFPTRVHYCGRAPLKKKNVEYDKNCKKYKKENDKKKEKTAQIKDSSRNEVGFKKKSN